MAGHLDGEMRHAVLAYQVARMRGTHAEMLRSLTYGPLCEFFLRDLYSSQDAPASGAAFSGLATLLRRILPGWIYEGAIGVVDLQDLSRALDDRIVRALLSRGASAHFSDEEFEEAYLSCDDYTDRVRQIGLAGAAIEFAFALSRHPSVGRLLALAHGFRGLPRVASLLGILERGYRAFREADEITPLIEDMRVGEKAYLDRIYTKARPPTAGPG